MATAGMGDCLAGLIISFIAQGLSIKEACCTGIYLHGLTGDQLSEKHLISVLASDVANEIPQTLKKASRKIVKLVIVIPHA